MIFDRTGKEVSQPGEFIDLCPMLEEAAKNAVMAGSIGKSTIVDILTSPRLTERDPVAVAKCLRARERYEQQIKERQFQNPGLRPEPYLCFVDRDLLESMVFWAVSSTLQIGRQPRIGPSNALRHLFKALLRRHNPN